ncbi:MAG: oligosaccharide flippase family protein [Candidatus Methanomethyliales bacterium]|nr:oligosaccharide flippase family protein [Candidatus Methanomethylicales archaeon]
MPLYLSSLTQNIIGVYRGMILAWFATNFMVGNFTIALNFDFATLILLLTGPITTALFPAFSKLNPLGEEMRRMVKYAVKYTATLIIPASAFVIVMAKDLVSIIYGSSYTLAPELLSVYCIAFLYAGLGSVMWGSFFNGISETKVNLKSTLIYATFFIPLAFLLAQSYNVLGLMLAMLLSSLASLIYILQIATRKFNLSIDKESALKIYIASAVSAMPVPPLAYLSPLPSLINLIIGATCYASIYLTIMPIIGGLPGRH